MVGILVESVVGGYLGYKAGQYLVKKYPQEMRLLGAFLRRHLKK